MPTTSPDSIYYADGTTPASIATITASMATSVQNALNVRETKSYIWPDAAARSAQTGMINGQIGYQTDNATYYIYSGAWLIWAKAESAYTPLFTNFTASASAFVYSISGGRVFITGKFTCSTTLPTGIITFSLPPNYDVNTAYLDLVRAAVIGTGGVDDASTTTDYALGIRPVTVSSASLVAYNAAATSSLTMSSTSATVPLTWASGDTAYVNFSYPVA